MTTLDVATVDLAALVAMIRDRFGSPPTGAIVGRTQMRDAVVEHLACSSLEAEQLVDTLVGRGLVRLERSADGQDLWRSGGGA